MIPLDDTIIICCIYLCMCVSICGEMRQCTYFIFLWILLLVGWREVDGRKTGKRRKSWWNFRVPLMYTSLITVSRNNFSSWFLIWQDTIVLQWRGYILLEHRNMKAHKVWGSHEGPGCRNLKPGRHWWFCVQLGYEDSPNHAQYKNDLQAHFFLSIA